MMLCPPAAAISIHRLTLSWPFTSAKVKLRGLYMFEKLLTGIDLHSLEGIFSIEKVDNLLDILCSIYL